jgi:hypothetical protein
LRRGAWKEPNGREEQIRDFAWFISLVLTFAALICVATPARAMTTVDLSQFLVAQALPRKLDRSSIATPLTFSISRIHRTRKQGLPARLS